jgi:hypothetical protein
MFFFLSGYNGQRNKYKLVNLRGFYSKSEICISGMATFSRHSLPTQPKSREEKTAWLYNYQFQNRRHKQQSENPRGYRLGTVSGKTNCHWGLKPDSRVHQPHTCPNRFSYEQTNTSLGEVTSTHP